MFFGRDYEPAVTILIWLSVMQALRVAKAGPAIAAVAKGETMNPLLANIPRAVLLLFAALAVVFGGGILTVVTMAMIGEAVAFGLSILLTKRLLSAPSARVGLPSVMSLGVLGLICISPFLDFRRLPSLANLVPEILIVVVALPVLSWLLWSIRKLAG